MWIFLSIVAFLAVLITVILMLPVSIIIKKDKNNELFLRYKLLFKTFGENPNPDAPIVKTLKKASGISRLEKENLKLSGKETDLSQPLGIVIDLLRELVAILKHCTAKKVSIKVVCAREDAADTAISYGKCCALVYPFVGFLNSAMKVRKKGQHIDISCDYLGGEEDFHLDFLITVRVCRVLAAFLRIAFAEAKRTVDEQTTPKDDKTNPQKRT